MKNKDYIMRPAGSQTTGLVTMIRTCQEVLQKQLIVLEIGSYRGESTEILLKTGLVEHITCVDLWQNDYDNDDAASYTTPIPEIEKQFDERLNIYSNVKKIKGNSNDIHSEFDNESFDLVYIDGDHRYEGCKNDIINFLPKVKNGGFIAGHDGHHPPIMRAIRDTIEKIDLNFVDTSWLKRILRNKIIYKFVVQ